MFDDEDWVYTPGAYIAYPQYDYKPTERREDFAFQSQLGYKRRSAATARRSNHGRVGWNSSLKAPYRPLGTPRFDITARPKPPVEDARLQIKHPSRGKQRDAGERESDAHKNLEPGKEVMGKVSQFKFQVRVASARRARGATLAARTTTSRRARLTRALAAPCAPVARPTPRAAAAMAMAMAMAVLHDLRAVRADPHRAAHRAHGRP